MRWKNLKSVFLWQYCERRLYDRDDWHVFTVRDQFNPWLFLRIGERKNFNRRDSCAIYKSLSSANHYKSEGSSWLIVPFYLFLFFHSNIQFLILFEAIQVIFVWCCLVPACPLSLMKERVELLNLFNDFQLKASVWHRCQNYSCDTLAATLAINTLIEGNGIHVVCK